MSEDETQLNPPKPRRQPWWYMPDNEWEATLCLAEALGETEKIPRQQLGYIVHRCGIPFAEAVLAQVWEVEANGGMFIRSGKRRRTPGGVFFELAWKAMNDQQRYNVRGDRMRAAGKFKKRGAASAQQPALPRLVWDDRQEVIALLLEEPGTATTVKVMLIGRPTAVQPLPPSALRLQMPPITNSPRLPKGVPTPPELPPVIAYISYKHWQKVVGSLNEDPEDILVLEGICGPDMETGESAVYVTRATTREQQRAQHIRTIKGS
jgi:hypothetical protein